MFADRPVSQIDPHSLPLAVEFVPRSRLEQFLASARRPLLGVVQHGVELLDTAALTCPRLPVYLKTIAAEPILEIWSGRAASRQGQFEQIQYSYNDDVLFGCLHVPDDAAIETAAFNCYSQIFNLIEEQGYRHLLRIWNYFSSINGIQEETERYQLFCVGRARAFQNRYGESFFNKVPAASALGTRMPGLSIYFIAGREPGEFIENPWQVSAYHYPREYGPCSPSFARATYQKWPAHQHLYVSGTASIVGHASTHIGDVHGQLQETLRNINNLLRHTATKKNIAGKNKPILLKVYLRDAADLEVVRNTITEHFGIQTPILYLEGDICRRELLLEIEGIYDILD